MKKILLLIALLFLTRLVFAADATPTATPQDQKLEDLKDRLASAATQLQQSQRRAITGVVKDTSVSTITVETATKDIKIELTDEIKVAQTIKGKRTDLTTDDISKGDTITVFGDYESTLDLLKAKFIYIEDGMPERISGTITDVTKKDYTLTVKTFDGTEFIVDIETSTKMIAWDEENGTSKGAFSKFTVGDTVFVLETAEKAANRVSALRVLDLGNLKGETPTPTSSPSATPKP